MQSSQTDITPHTKLRRERIKWPKMSDTKDLDSLDKVLDRILEVTAAWEQHMGKGTES